MQPLTIEIIRKWDARAAKMLYEHFYAALVSYALQFTKDAETSEDMVQDIITALWERKIEFSSLPMMKAYLYKSVRNRCLNYLQRPSSLGSPLTKFTNSDEAFSMIDEDSEQIFTEEVYRQLFLMIDQMPQRQREVFLMVMEGRKTIEMPLTMPGASGLMDPMGQTAAQTPHPLHLSSSSFGFTFRMLI